ncbi:MAG: D-alanyl-D-alanine carboxypeptidase, partial [Planctomycetota bacterium]
MLLLPAPGKSPTNTPDAKPRDSHPSAPVATRDPSLLVRGSGDPAFGDPGLLASAGLYLDDLIDLWVTAVKDTGHTRFETLYLDDRAFDRVFVHPSWPQGQLHRYSYAQVAGLNFYENLLAVLPVPAENFGQAPTVQVEPYFSSLRTTNRATTGDADLFDIQRPAGGNRFIFTGSVRNRR